MRFTVLGNTGFIGRALVSHLRQKGMEVLCPGRHDLLTSESLGHVIYCIGLTADFRSFPLETVEAHVCKLLEVLKRGNFTSLLYLSSTRVYGAAPTTQEDSPCTVTSTNPSDLYNLSKLMGESACLAISNPAVRVVRLSNVFGPDWTSENFLTSIIKDAVKKGSVHLRTARKSNKDYVALSDVVDIIPQIVLHGQRRLYNVASGNNTSHEDLLLRLQELSGCSVSWDEKAPLSCFPTIFTQTLGAEFTWRPHSVLDELPELVNACKKFYD
jgi:nucleoside-diphosphate-sugar epimerase